MSIAVAHHAAPAFDADFYTVAATVIPVLFLAIAIQGRIFENLLTGSNDVVKATDSTIVRADVSGTQKFIIGAGGMITALVMYFLAVAVVFLGWLGELISVQALYDQGPAAKPNSIVFCAIIVLTIVVVGEPFLRICQERMKEGDERRARKRSAAGAPGP
jgi:hypothetical protein